MPKIAGTYDYQDPRDPSDTFDRFERADYEPRDRDGGSAERGRPFTASGDRILRIRQGITICPTPVQPEPKPPGLSKMQEAWALTFDPLAGLDEAMATCREHIRSYQSNIRQGQRQGIAHPQHYQGHSVWHDVRGRRSGDETGPSVSVAHHGRCICQVAKARAPADLHQLAE